MNTGNEITQMHTVLKWEMEKISILSIFAGFKVLIAFAIKKGNFLYSHTLMIYNMPYQEYNVNKTTETIQKYMLKIHPHYS